MSDHEQDPRHGPHALPRLGRRMTDRTAEMTFPVARDRALVYLITLVVGVTGALVSWLCVSTMAMREQLVKMDERNSVYQEQIKALVESDQQQQLATARINLELKELQLQAASHGWKRGQ